jgi:hypothetical protein
MPTLTVRNPSKRDWLRVRRVQQRRANLTPPWDYHVQGADVRHQLTSALTGFGPATDQLVAVVDGEVCAFALFERGDERFRWYVTEIGAGSPRLDATEEVAIELWVALLEEGIRRAGEAGARRIFAFVEPESSEYEGLREAGFDGYTNYYILRGRMPLPESAAVLSLVRPQHESDLWSIHQLYNHSTPRGVQFAEALTSDAWALPDESRNPFARTTASGFVVPLEDGIGAACQIGMRGRCPYVTFLCDERLESSIASIVAASLARAGIDREVDVVVPGYQQHLMSQFLALDFAIMDERIGMVRHTTVPAVIESNAVTSLNLREARTAASIPYQTLNARGGDTLMRDHA